MPKPNHLFDHLVDPQNKDRRGLLHLNSSRERLRFSYTCDDGNWATVARLVAQSTMSALTWFPDSNVCFLDATSPVWEALRLAGLGNPTGSTVISNVIAAELSDWLSEPYRNEDRAASIKAAISNETWIKSFRLEGSESLRQAAYYYTNLLGFRRSLARPFRLDGSTFVNTAASDRPITMNAIKDSIGFRAVGLAKKGRNDEEKTGWIKLNDEMHCLTAIVYALTTGRETVILTADADFLEVFYKAQWFIDMHYRAGALLS